MNNSDKIAKLKKALNSPTTPESLKGQLQAQIVKLEKEDLDNAAEKPSQKKQTKPRTKKENLVIGYMLLDSISGEMIASKKTLPELKKVYDDLDQNEIGEGLDVFVYEINVVKGKNKQGKRVDVNWEKPKPKNTTKPNKKYYSNREIKSVTVIEDGKNVTYKASDLFDGASFLEKGGKTDEIIELYPLQLIPLEPQLKKITGESLSFPEYTDENGNDYGKSNTIVHKKSNQKFKIPNPIYRYIDGYNLVHNIFQKKITVYESGALVAEIKDNKLDFTNKDKSVIIDRTKVRNAFENGFIPDSANANNFYKDLEQKLFSKYAMYEDLEDNKESSEVKKLQAEIKELEDIQHKLERKYEKGNEVFDYKQKYEKTKIKSIDDVKQFFKYLHNTEKLVFHPDDEFLGNMEDYITKKQAMNLDRYMLDCFEVCEKEKKDIYEIAAQTVGIYAKGGWTKDHKYLNKKEDYEVRYAKGKNRKEYKADGGPTLEIEPGDIVKYSNPTEGEKKFNFVVQEIHNDEENPIKTRVLMTLIDSQFSLPPTELVRLSDVELVHKMEKNDKTPTIGRKAKGVSLDKIAKMHGVTKKYLQKQIEKGQKIELEHTTDEAIAYAIAKDHLYENPDYYILLNQIEMKVSGGEVKTSKFKLNDILVPQKDGDYSEEYWKVTHLDLPTNTIKVTKYVNGKLKDEYTSSVSTYDEKFRLANEEEISDLNKLLENLANSSEFKEGGFVDWKSSANSGKKIKGIYEINSSNFKGYVEISGFERFDDTNYLLNQPLSDNRIGPKEIHTFKVQSNKINNIDKGLTVVALDKNNQKVKIKRVANLGTSGYFEKGGQTQSKPKRQGSKIFDKAKEIREPGEKWQEAVKRANLLMKK